MTIPDEGEHAENAASQKRRRPRPSRSRGLRTTSGCLTCRKRRLKCDEGKPVCVQCTKSSRDCSYDHLPTGSISGPQADQISPTSPISESRESFSRQDQQPISGQFGLHEVRPTHSETGLEKVRSLESHQGSFSAAFHTASPAYSFASPRTTSSFTPGAAPQDWFELLANDAVKDLDNYNFLTANASRWSFEPRPSPHSGPEVIQSAPVVHHSPKSSLPLPAAAASSDQAAPPAAGDHQQSNNRIAAPWNTSEPHVLRQYELSYLQYYIEHVAPILDLYDPQHHFSVHLIHLALRNVGILKSMLAVAALHRARTSGDDSAGENDAWSPAGAPQEQPMPDGNMATQYYYETLGYLSQAMKYSEYHRSQEILANAILISWYEAFDTEASLNWERHLKGVFWIQRSQDNNGESGGLRQAVWWNWLRQDVWAAFRHSRKTLTIWRPTKHVTELSHDELACRAVYLQAKAVGYASEEIRKSLDFGQRIEEGDMLLNALQEWFDCLPRAFRPLPAHADPLASAKYPPVWIHPPAFAAAMQAYYSAKILILVNRPSLGGRHAWLDVQQPLDEALNMICGIAQAPNASNIPLAIVNTQALFIGESILYCKMLLLTKEAGQFVHMFEQQEIILRVLEETLRVTKIPSSSLTEELRHMWYQR